MVDLVLHRPRYQAAPRHLDLAALPVLCNDPNPLAPGYVSDVTGDGEAALELAVVPVASDDPRVDELVELVIDFDNACSHRHADLRCGQSRTRGVAHGIGQVVEQLVQVLAKGVDRFAFDAQTRVAEENDRSDTHGREYTEAVRRSWRRPARDLSSGSARGFPRHIPQCGAIRDRTGPRSAPPIQNDPAAQDSSVREGVRTAPC